MSHIENLIESGQFYDINYGDLDTNIIDNIYPDDQIKPSKVSGTVKVWFITNTDVVYESLYLLINSSRFAVVRVPIVIFKQIAELITKKSKKEYLESFWDNYNYTNTFQPLINEKLWGRHNTHSDNKS